MNETILVVDDEQEIADLVAVYLKNEGYRVQLCGTAAAALACIETNKPDLAILDVMLPDMDGFSLCRRIRQQHLFPIVMLTARGNGVTNMVRITMQDGGVIDLELDAQAAPITVENFLKLVKDGFYDGLTFHRIIPGFMIQGGCPDGTGMGGPGWHIKGEFARNGVPNPIKHTRGVISMARAMDPNSASSQFFIMHEDAPHLDGGYAAFGHVVAGMDVVDRIAEVATDYNDRPLTPVVMESVRVVEE